MPVDAGGNATRPSSPIPVSGQTADAPQVNVPINDIYAILNMLVFLDGRKSLRGNIPMNGHRARGAADAEQPQDYVTLSQVQAFLTDVATPSGIIQAYTVSSSVAPAGWIFANGQTLQRSVFPNLWAAVQSGNNLAATEAVKTHGQYGPGNGTTTFTVPNLYADGGYFIRPMTSGRAIGTTQQDEIKRHKHNASASMSGAHDHGISYANRGDAFGSSYAMSAAPGGLSRRTSTNGAHNHIITVGEEGGTETRPKNIAYPVIIKL